MVVFALLKINVSKHFWKHFKGHFSFVITRCGTINYGSFIFRYFFRNVSKNMKQFWQKKETNQNYGKKIKYFKYGNHYSNNIKRLIFVNVTKTNANITVNEVVRIKLVKYSKKTCQKVRLYPRNKNRVLNRKL